MNCVKCGEARDGKPARGGGQRLPRNWTRHQEATWCERCWDAHWCLRSAVFPLVGPVGAEWPEFREALRACWANSTQWANWAVRELVKADVVRGPADERLPAMPAVYLYGEWTRLGYPTTDGASRQAVFREVERKYRARRLDVVWRRAAAPPSFRYPVPYPVHTDSWRAELGPDNVPLVSLPLDGRRWTLRLRGGAEFRRQLAVFHAIVSGEARQGAASLYVQTVSASAHRNGLGARAPGGANGRLQRVMLKLVAEVPRRPIEPTGSTLLAKTTGESFLIYRLDDEEPKYYHADHLKRWQAEHRRRLDRMADDTKHEKRWPRATRQRMLGSMDAWVRKHRHRIDTLTHDASALLAGYAARRRAARVVLDTSDRSIVAEFPWHELVEKLRYKLEERGIALEEIRPAADADRERDAG